MIDADDFIGHNLFAYCDNTPINKVDYTGEDGKYIELGNGWYCRIDPQDTTTGTQRHIHIWNDRKGVSYAQNKDGSPHDKNNNDQGKLPKWLQKELHNKTGWDYNGNRNSFFEATECEHWVEGIQYTFANGTTAFRAYHPFMLTRYSVDSYEGIYFNSEINPSVTSNATHPLYLPIVKPAMLPSFSFGPNWGMFPIPLLY